ncbi:MAG: hypothetical protein J5809_07415 [Selenomonadaceae bacterium]|nr:hypothetical protein [Selenomonadaceae bacterium]
MALTLPTPPTPPTIDKGEATEYTPKIDAHKFFEVPFSREKKSVAQDAEEISPPPPVETKTPTPEEMAREAVANGSGALTKTEVTRPDAEKIPAASIPVPADNPRDGKAILREFENYDDTYAAAETPRTFHTSQRESHSGIFWVVTLILAAVLSIVFVKKFMLKPKPKRVDKAPAPVPKKDDKRRHFEVRV